MTNRDRQFYSALALISGGAFIAFGYLTIFTAGLGLLVAALVSAVAAALIYPRPLRVAVAVLESALALVPLAWFGIFLGTQ